MSLLTTTPTILDYTRIGTVAGTTTISSEPNFLHAITVTQRVASGRMVIYDSAGTSSNVIGTIDMGTNTANDAPSTYLFDVRTKNGLTISNTANLGGVVSSGR